MKSGEGSHNVKQGLGTIVGNKKDNNGPQQLKTIMGKDMEEQETITGRRSGKRQWETHEEQETGMGSSRGCHERETRLGIPNGKEYATTGNNNGEQEKRKQQ